MADKKSITSLDHLLWAVPDLDGGSLALSQLTGVAPARGGTHPGFGTRNSLLALGADTYLEIIAPDPDQALTGTRGGTIAEMTRPGLITFAVRTADLAAYAAAASSVGATATGPVAMSRTRPDGVRLDWACMYVQHPVYGDAIPFAIDWQSAPHPAAVAPSGCQLLDFTVLHPEPEPLRAIYAELGIPVSVKAAAAAGFLATLSAPRGEIVLMQA